MPGQTPLPCPKCPKSLPDEQELYAHLRNVHKLSPDEIKRLLGSRTPGWHEEQTEQPGGRAVAVDHQAAAVRAKFNRDEPISVPIIRRPEPKKELIVPAGWVKTPDGYQFERVVYEKQTAENALKQVVRAQIMATHLQAMLYTYDKDITELSELQEKERVLNSRLAGYVVSDPEFKACVDSLHDISVKIKEIKKDLSPQVYTEIVLEDFFRGDVGTDEHIKWQEESMKKAMDESERIKERLKETGA